MTKLIGLPSPQKLFLWTVISYILLFVFSNGVNGGADTYVHYQMSKYSWEHHDLLLNQWGKPIFTILFSPIAQLGLKAVVLTNLALILFEAYLVFEITKKLKIAHAWLAAFLFLWAPVVFGNAISSLTEMICALFLLLFIHWALKGRYALGAVVLSFMPFARSEGFVIIGVVALYFLFTRKWKYLPLLVIGSVIFDVAGYLYTGFPLWIFDSNPYVNTDITVYGHGSLFHFFYWAVPVFGVAFLLVLWATWDKLRTLARRLSEIVKPTSDLEETKILFWVVFGGFWGYFLAHTMLWFLGMWASLGLTRVMFVVAGPMAILATLQWNKFLSHRDDFFKRKWNRIFVGLTFVGAIVSNAILQSVPVRLGVEEELMQEACDWTIEQGIYTGQRIYSGHAYTTIALNKDPFDPNQFLQLRAYSSAQPKDLIYWEGHFGPNEEQVELMRLETDSSLVLLKEFWPEHEYRPLNDHPFHVRVYQKK